MKYIEKDKCLAGIDETRINRKKGANVYVYATKREMGMMFAYSDEKEDEVYLSKYTPEINSDHENDKDGIWKELLEIAGVIKSKYKVNIFIDDVRPEPAQNVA